MRVLAIRVLVGVTLVTALPGVAGALVIEYQAVDLADTTAGDDLWEYRYRVGGGSFLGDQGFSVYFDWALYVALQDPPPAVNADWSPLILQPDTGLPDDGLYDALALVDAPSLLDTFVVRFVWRGAPSGPGSQPWTMNQFDAAGNFLGSLARGATVPIGGSVPEPSALILFAVAAGSLLAGRRRNQKGVGSNFQNSARCTLSDGNNSRPLFPRRPLRSGRS
jgi:hypothetical protein